MSALRCADVAELADALDSGSSGHCARAGSSPVIRSNADKVIRNDDLFLLQKTEKAERKMRKPRIYLQGSGLFYFAIDLRSRSIRMAGFKVSLSYFYKKWYSIQRCINLNTRWRFYDAFRISEKGKTLG